MKRFLYLMLFPLILVAGNALADTATSVGENPEKQTITHAKNRSSFARSEHYFTGKVKVDMSFSPDQNLPASGAYVRFEPGARSAWHTHPAGQTLIVVSGVGRTQVWGGSVVEIRPGDVVQCPVGVKHWHGAAPNSPMTHFAITGDKNGKNVTWMEKVTDAQYQGK